MALESCGNPRRTVWYDPTAQYHLVHVYHLKKDSHLFISCWHLSTWMRHIPGWVHKLRKHGWPINICKQLWIVDFLLGISDLKCGNKGSNLLCFGHQNLSKPLERHPGIKKISVQLFRGAQKFDKGFPHGLRVHRKRDKNFPCFWGDSSKPKPL